MAKAVVEFGGIQFVVEEGEEYQVPLLNSDKGQEFYVEQVLALKDEQGIWIGTPFLEGIRVKCQHLGTVKGKKLQSIRFKPYTGLKKIRGHRQAFSRVKVLAVERRNSDGT